MARFSVTVDDSLIEAARSLAKVRTKQQAIEQALTEFVERRKIDQLIGLMGSDIIDLTPEEIRKSRDLDLSPEERLRWRAGGQPKRRSTR